MPVPPLAAAGDAGGHHRSAGSARDLASARGGSGRRGGGDADRGGQLPGAGSVAAGLPQKLLSLTGARQDLAGLVVIAPSAGTLRPALIALDADEPDRAAERGCASTPAMTSAAGQSRWTVRT